MTSRRLPLAGTAAIYPSAHAACSARALLLGGSAVRISYGVGSLLAPAAMVRARYAPDTHELPDPRLLLRAFGGHQLVVGCLTLASLRSVPRMRCAAALSMLIDALDVGSAILEQRARGERDRTIAGGYLISGAGMLAFATALCTLRRGRARAGEARDELGANL